MPMNLLLVVFSLLLNGCSHEPLYQSQSYVFGTLVSLPTMCSRNSSACMTACTPGKKAAI